MLLYINGGGGLTIESMVSENKIETWKVYGRGRQLWLAVLKNFLEDLRIVWLNEGQE
jgi:hypothetical protein